MGVKMRSPETKSGVEIGHQLCLKMGAGLPGPAGPNQNIVKSQHDRNFKDILMNSSKFHALNDVR